MTIAQIAPLRTGFLPPPGTYMLNPDRCRVQFSFRHMLVATARGVFTPIEGQLVLADDPLASWLRVDLDAASVDTGSSERDNAVRGADLLDAAAFPIIRFESVAIDEIEAGRFAVTGDLYVKDFVSEVMLLARLVSVAPDRVLVSAAGEVTRHAVGLARTTATDRVRIELGAEFVR